jgi:hypothetical protein
MSSKASESICIISHYSQEIKPAETIIFSEEFDGTEISNIPEVVEHIEIKKVRYIQKLIRLPESLKTLHLNCSFREIKLPDSLEYLKLGKYFNGEIKQWPKSLKNLLICSSDIGSLPLLPNSLEYLRLSITSKYKFIEVKYQWIRFPKSLKTLIVKSWLMKSEEIISLKELSNLKHLEFEGGFSSVSAVNAIISNLPSGLKILKGLNILGSPKDIQGQFPDSLECIIGDFNYKDTLPKSLKVFYCPSCKISSPLPKSLQYLYISSVKGEALKSISQLPSLETLVLNEYNPSYEKDISFPSSLQHLEIKSSSYNITSLPSNLKTLIIPSSALRNSIKLPEKLETLKLIKCGFESDLYLPSGFKITFQSN